ncbi:Heat shock protein 15 homolog (HSP15) [Herminiimonas arsenicoxydans]|uniref:Heat shock protein 15 homolog (HSP15) n=1 Tax=Herminiimonas arsenicoxydans TaxID=204773 RepID=A4G8W6_HERAR|nr:Heat shock protein 15 homolog (HSP15) [Herminiimonas arsenicoxydans]
MTTESVRIDKWLWAARFFKTRTLASDAVDNGKVRIERERIKPARNVRCGDLVQIDNGSSVWEVLVRGLSDVRGSAEMAQKLYAETEESIVKRQQEADKRKFFKEPGMTIKGRPTKRDRRLLDKTNQ